VEYKLIFEKPGYIAHPPTLCAELAKEWAAIVKRMRILKDELYTLGLRQAEIEGDLDKAGTSPYEVLDDEKANEPLDPLFFGGPPSYTS